MEHILRDLNRLCLLSLGLSVFASCSEEEMGGNAPESKPEIVKVSFQTGSGDQKTKIWYGQEGSQFKANWLVGDKVSIVNSGFKQSDALDPFEAQSDGEAPRIEGELASWTGERTLYAVHPHKDDYYGFNGSVFTYKSEDQVIDVNSDQGVNSQSVNNELLLAVADKATFEDGEGGKKVLAVNDLFFKQAMSFLRFEIGGLPSGCTLQSVRITEIGCNLINKSEISIVPDGDKGDIKYNNIKQSGKLIAEIVNHKPGDNAIINLALVPTKLIDPVLTIRAKDEAGKEYKYTKQLPTLDFIRNRFNYYSTPLMVGTDDFDEERVYSIADIVKGDLPADGNVTLNTTELNEGTQGFDTLKLKIKASKVPVRLKFPDLEKVEGKNLFEKLPNLKVVEMPYVREIGDETFQECPQLDSVYMPALEKAGIWTFDDDDGLKDKTVVFVAATNPGIKLTYGKDGSRNGLSSDYTVSRVTLVIGNKESYRHGTDYINFTGGKQYFGKIMWVSEPQ